MTNQSPHWLVPDGWVRAEVIPQAGGPDYRLLWYANGDLRFEHPCIAGDGSACINAPLITKHDVAERDGKVTISPSILCHGCNTHGFIAESRWRVA